MNIFVKFFHEIMNPHCTHCVEEKLENQFANVEHMRCRSCESLERQLAIANQQVLKLTEKIVNPSAAPIPQTTNEIAPKPLRRSPLPFSAIRPHLEAESRAAAQAARNAAQPDTVVESTVVVEPVEIKEEIKVLEDLVFEAKIKSEETGVKQG